MRKQRVTEPRSGAKRTDRAGLVDFRSRVTWPWWVPGLRTIDRGDIDFSDRERLTRRDNVRKVAVKGARHEAP